MSLSLVLYANKYKDYSNLIIVITSYAKVIHLKHTKKKNRKKDTETKNNNKKIFCRYMASSLDGKKIIKSKTFFDLKNYKSLSFGLGKQIKKII